MAKEDIDAVTGTATTGHEWDGIKELNTPLPKWWVYVFWATVLWAIGYWIAMPAWPTPTGFTAGMLNYSSRANVAEDLKAQQASRAQWMAKLQNASAEDIVKDKALLNFSQQAGKALFGENCSACHGAGGVGVPGAYPRLADDEWIWGGTLADIEQTIKFGVRNAHPDSRQTMSTPSESNWTRSISRLTRRTCSAGNSCRQTSPRRRMAKTVVGSSISGYLSQTAFQTPWMPSGDWSAPTSRFTTTSSIWSAGIIPVALLR